MFRFIDRHHEGRVAPRLLIFAVILTGILLHYSVPLQKAFAQPGSEKLPVSSPDEGQPEEDKKTEDKKIKEGGAIPTTPIELILALRQWVFPFSLATLIALWFSTERLVVLRKGRVIPKPFVERFLTQLEAGELTPNEALNLCEENGSPTAKVFEHGVRKWGKPSVEVEQAVIDGGERQISDLRCHLRIINGVATVCPLIGLLGTVWGMIDAFNGIAGDSAGNREELAAGIALALLTTAAGLLIAIPSLIIYLYLTGRVDRLVMEMDDLAREVVQHISAEGLQGSAPVSASRRLAPQKKKPKG